MDKKTGIIIVICLFCFILFRVYIALNVPSAGGENQQTAFDFPLGLPTVFTGTLPCASCPGIETHLLVDSTGFREVSRYIGEDDGPFTTYGTWKLSADSLLLKNGGEVHKTFFLENNSLHMMDQSLNRIEGDLAKKYLLTYSEMENKIRKRHEELRKREFRFVASGNEPFWSVRVTGKNYIIYETPQERKSGSLVQRSFGKASTELNAVFGSGETLELDISEAYCRDSMSGFMFTHNVTFQFDGGDRQKGCGRFLNEVFSAKQKEQ